MNNTKIGTETEKTISGIFRERGYWVYNCPKSSVGSQPVDLIAIKREIQYLVWLVDGKHVREQDASFKLDRIEDNQWISLQYAHDYANIKIENLGFVIEFERTNTFYWLGYQQAIELRDNKIKSINLSNLRLFEEVLDEYDNIQ